MNRYFRTHLSSCTLLENAATRVAGDRGNIADLLADLGEIEVRKLHLEAGYPSMFAFCVGEYHFTEQTALKRIRVARVARHFPVLFEAIADGRLNLTSVILLTRHLTPGTVDELVAAATHRTSAEIEQLLAERYPRPWEVTELSGRLSARTVAGSDRARVTPIAPHLYRLEMALGQSARDKLRHLQELLSHQIPSGDLEQVVEHALDIAIRQVEKRKFAAADRPRPGQASPSANPRQIPVEVQRAVWQRDGGACTFVSTEGRRCGSRWQVEFDHVQPVANGGAATIDNVRLLCRAHNQFAAECAFGPGFMQEKRLEATEARAAASAPVEAPAGPELGSSDSSEAGSAAQHRRDLESGLRNLGFRAGDACEAVAFALRIQGASLEERMRAAISYLRPRRSGQVAGSPRAA